MVKHKKEKKKGMKRRLEQDIILKLYLYIKKKTLTLYLVRKKRKKKKKILLINYLEWKSVLVCYSFKMDEGSTIALYQKTRSISNINSDPTF